MENKIEVYYEIPYVFGHTLLFLIVVLFTKDIFAEDYFAYGYDPIANTRLGLAGLRAIFILGYVLMTLMILFCLKRLIFNIPFLVFSEKGILDNGKLF